MNRGMYFIVVLWGERFRNYFLDYCLPSLLAPGNIPALENKTKSKFLICTTEDDWLLLWRSRSFEFLTKHIEPVFLRIDPLPKGGHVHLHMSKAHHDACDYVQQKRGCAMFLQPDTMISDGAIVALQKHSAAGKKLVICAAIRFAEEALFRNLEIVKVPVLSLSPRKLAAAAIVSMHPETAAYEWKAPYATTIFPIVWWRYHDAVLLHSISWEPLLVDYDRIEKHDLSTFSKWTIDGDYLARNVDWKNDIHVVTDSDEICFVSWTPENKGPQWRRFAILRWRTLREYVRGGQMRRMFTSPLVDPMKRDLFPIPICWHAKDLPSHLPFAHDKIVAMALSGRRRGDWLHVLVELAIHMASSWDKIAGRIMVSPPINVATVVTAAKLEHPAP